jgi:hypothetical protein
VATLDAPACRFAETYDPEARKQIEDLWRKGSNLLLATSADAAYALAKLCVRLYP